MKEKNRKVVVLTKNGARVLGLLFWMGVAVCSGGTVKWSGAGDGSRWSDLANWVDGGTVDFAKAHVYDLSAAEDGANDRVSSIGGFVLGAGQGTVTLSSTVAASALHGTWTIPASTTFVLKQVYRGMWSDYGTTTVSGGGTLRLDAADFQSANRAWNIEGGTVVELAHGFPVDPSDPGGVGCGGDCGRCTETVRCAILHGDGGGPFGNHERQRFWLCRPRREPDRDVVSSRSCAGGRWVAEILREQGAEGHEGGGDGIRSRFAAARPRRFR